MQGIAKLTNGEAAGIVGDDRESHQRDLFEAIERGNYPKCLRSDHPRSRR